MEWFADNGWIAWVGLALVLAAVEVATVTFFFLMLTGGALAGALAAALGLGIVWQVVIACVVALALTALVRPPLVRRVTRTEQTHRFGAAAYVGEEAVVTETVTRAGGRIKITSDSWSARSESSHPIAPGQVVRVLSIDGAIAVVEPVAPTGSPVERH